MGKLVDMLAYHCNYSKKVIPLYEVISASKAQHWIRHISSLYPIASSCELPRHQSEKHEDIGDDENGGAATNNPPTLVRVDIRVGSVHPKTVGGRHSTIQSPK